MTIRLFDGHCDTAFELWRRKASLRQNTCHVDLRKAAAFEAYAQVFSFCSYAGEPLKYAESREAYLTEPLSYFRSEVRNNSNSIAFARTKDEIQKVNSAGKVAALLSLEGPELISCDPYRLPELKNAGFCMTTLTWNADNALAGCHFSDLGLTDCGKAFVRMAQQLDILIDVSHLSDRAFWDLIHVTQKPILASHSDCRALFGVSRNLTDDQLRAIAQTGGTVGLNLYADFLGKDAAFSDVLRHLEHLLTVCGEEHVALGGDLDGCNILPSGFSDLSSYERLYFELRSAGYSGRLTDQIFYENLLNLL